VQPLFLSVDARQRETWREAFPDLQPGSIDEVPAGQGLIWVLQPGGRAASSVVKALSRHLEGRSLILLADEPSESEAMEALAAGASGYCNGHAAPEVLQQVAKVVENGGIWVGQGLMQRLLASTARLASRPEADEAAWRALLTPREQAAAVLLARGASNKEIARQLQITERTVKAHVGAMFEKLGVRDRLQLALIINGIDSPR
jgi:DNA-binding NarL/FixJ family response regulator